MGNKCKCLVTGYLRDGFSGSKYVIPKERVEEFDKEFDQLCVYRQEIEEYRKLCVHEQKVEEFLLKFDEWYAKFDEWRVDGHLYQMEIIISKQ